MEEKWSFISYIVWEQSKIPKITLCPLLSIHCDGKGVSISKSTNNMSEYIHPRNFYSSPMSLFSIFFSHAQSWKLDVPPPPPLPLPHHIIYGRSLNALFLNFQAFPFFFMLVLLETLLLHLHKEKPLLRWNDALSSVTAGLLSQLPL